MSTCCRGVWATSCRSTGNRNPATTRRSPPPPNVSRRNFEPWRLARRALLVVVVRHAERGQVRFEQRFLLVAFALIEFPNAHDLAHDLDVETGALGFGIDFADVLAERTTLVLEPFDPLDEGTQPIARDAADICHKKNPPAPKY